MKPVYLDYAATTPADPAVIELMLAHLGAEGVYANAASNSHELGRMAKVAVEQAREQVAALLNASAQEMVWTSGATESNNLAITGAARANAKRGKHIVVSRIEHKAVLDTCKQLQLEGFEISWLEPDAEGGIDIDQLRQALRPDTVLVSLMHVNNELGVINDIGAAADLCRSAGVLLHVDAAQGAGKLPIDLQRWPIDLLSVSAHKLYGPKGQGALFVRRRPRARLQPLMFGGGHERGLRSGTLATHQIVGFGLACELAQQRMASDTQHIQQLSEQLWGQLQVLPHIYLNAAQQPRWPGILNISFEHVDGRALLAELPQLAVSTGSACTSATVEPSYVLRALGRSDALAGASLRLSIGRLTTAEEVRTASAAIVQAVQRLRDLSPLWRAVQQGQTPAQLRSRAHRST